MPNSPHSNLTHLQLTNETHLENPVQLYTLRSMPVDSPDGPAPEQLSSNVMNYLVWRYLQEAGTYPTTPPPTRQKQYTGARYPVLTTARL